MLQTNDERNSVKRINVVQGFTTLVTRYMTMMTVFFFTLIRCLMNKKSNQFTKRSISRVLTSRFGWEEGDWRVVTMVYEEKLTDKEWISLRTTTHSRIPIIQWHKNRRRRRGYIVKCNGVHTDYLATLSYDTDDSNNLRFFNWLFDIRESFTKTPCIVLWNSVKTFYW